MAVFEVVVTGTKSEIERAWSELAWREPSPTPAVDHQEIRHNVWQLRGYCETQEAAELAQKIIVGIAPDLTPKISVLAPTNWVEKSLEGLPVVEAGRFVIVGQHNSDAVVGGKTPILIEAGAAFGTGHHGTTLGALLALQKIVSARRPRTLLDIGTGTGVLSIAAQKMGVPNILGTDKDAAAIIVAKENILKNHCSGISLLTCAGTRHAMVQNKAPYDLICANIIAPVLKALSKDIPRLMTPGGQLILSGILHHQVKSIQTHYSGRGLVLRSKTVIEGWNTLVMEKSFEDLT